MEPEDVHPSIRCFNYEVGVSNSFYEPLTFISRADLRRQFRKANKFSFQPLFLQNIMLSQNNSAFKQQQPQTGNLKEQVSKDMKLKKIFQNTKQRNRKSSSSSKQSSQLKNQLYSFNYDCVLTFSETPNFKQFLQSPLAKFYRLNQQKIIQLSKRKNGKQKIKQLSLRENPIVYAQCPSIYFMGLALNLKNRNMNPLFFNNLAAYCEPFNQKIWEEYCQTLKRFGKYDKAAIMAKTGFLFNPISNLAEQYLMCAEKAGFPPHQMRGLLSSLSEPINYEKVLFQSAKVQMKHRKKWKALLLLFHYCLFLDFKSHLSQIIMFLVKNLELFQFKQIVQDLLSRAINQKLTKYQVFNLYIETYMRMTDGNINAQKLTIIEKKIKNVASETRYRVYLDMAQAVRPKKDQCKKYLKQAAQTAKKCCLQQINKKRAYRHIYLSILSMYSLNPDWETIKKFKCDDHLRFLNNKAKFIRNEPLQICEFQDWKYYLHYCLVKDSGILRRSYKKYKQGRLISEYIHLMRLSTKPLVMLKFWRKKIEQSPKSGELWCEGGRIYSDLKQYSNAKKCFLTAIHFTPQYGDSFFQLLKVLLIESRFLQINQLKKNFIVSQPFYGNVYSYLRSCYVGENLIKLSLYEVWYRCIHNIQAQLFRFENSQSFLTCCNDYNQDFKNQPYQKRQILFGSYELIQNKFSK